MRRLVTGTLICGALASFCVALQAEAGSEACNYQLLPDGSGGWTHGAGCPVGPCDPGECELEAEFAAPPQSGVIWYCVCEGGSGSPACVTKLNITEGVITSVTCDPIDCPAPQKECEIKVIGDGPAATCQCVSTADP